MFKINICGTIHEADKVEIKKQHLFIDDVDLGVVTQTLATKVIEGEYNFIQKEGYIGWLSK